MKSHEQLIAKLAILDAPMPPDWIVPLLIMGGIILVMPIAFIILALRIKNAHPKTHLPLKQQALVQLDKLESAWTSQQCDQRQAAYQLATLLRLGLALPQLDDSPFQNDPHWQQLTHTLNSLRYQANSENHLSIETFQHVRDWLIQSSTQQDQPC